MSDKYKLVMVGCIADTSTSRYFDNIVRHPHQDVYALYLHNVGRS